MRHADLTVQCMYMGRFIKLKDKKTKGYRFTLFPFARNWPSVKKSSNCLLRTLTPFGNVIRQRIADLPTA